jgi:membrane protease YdiL (CAAX protease family)
MTSTTGTPPTGAETFLWLEDKGRDFPFYNGAPVALSGAQWLIVMAAIVVGFLVLMLPIDWPGGALLGPLIPAVLMPLIPMVALAQVAPGHWRALFGKVGGREIRLMVGFALLNLVVSSGVGVTVGSFTQVASNASAAGLAELDAVGLVAFFAKTLPQLLGEEIITMLPFLAILHLCTHRLRMGRKAGVIVAWLVSALIFGLLHLPTYDWNVIQCVVIIGSARLVLTLPWIMTKNLWVSTGAHILNDWLLFSVLVLGAGLANQA